MRRRSGRQPQRGEHLRRRRAAARPPTRRAPRSPAPRARSRPGSSASTTTASAGAAARPLRFGDRVIARVPGRRGRSVNTTIRLGLQRTAQNALGDDLGGIAVIRPRDGAVLALAGLAVSAPQPPGSSMKIVTLAAALQNEVATPSSSYPVRTAATLSGVRLRNAGDESCGGSLANSFAHSCNSVFGPLGAKLGAQAAGGRRRALRLQREARRCPPPRPARSRRTSRTASRSARPRSGRSARRPRRSRWRAWRDDRQPRRADPPVARGQAARRASGS